MERSEPTLVPEWLKSSGSVTGGGATTHQIASSSLQSDEHVVSKSARNKSSVNISDRDIGRSFVLDRTTSSYFRRSSSTNGSAHSRSYSGFGRSNRDKDWEKDMYDPRDKEKSILGDHRSRDYSNHLGNIFPPRFEKEVLRRSQSMTTEKQGEAWPRKVAADSSNANKNNRKNGNGVLPVGSAISNVHKAAFERDFPSLGAEERQATPEIGRVSSPGLSTAFQSLSIGTSAAIGGDGWTSALAEVPVIVGSTGTGGSVQQAVPATSVPTASSMMTSLNMAETLAQGPSRAHTTPQPSAGTQRLEELAIKQSRQLIPVTPSMPKALVLNPSEKPKPKIGQQQQQISSPHLVNHSPRGGPAKSDVSKTPSVGKLQVLKPARERNGVSPTVKDSLSPTSGSKIANNPLAVSPSVVGSASLRSPRNNPNLASSERKPALTILEKRPTFQAQSRNDFFNLMRRKSMTNPSSAVPGSGPALSPSVLDKSDESEAGTAPVTPQGRDAPLSDTSVGDWSNEKRSDMNGNGNTSDRAVETPTYGKNHSSSDAILYSEEEEAAFLRSLGWEENAGEDEGLTEEEISAFHKKVEEYIKLRPSSRIFQGVQQKVLVPLNLQMESVGGGGASSGFSSSDSKLES
uniref:Mediator of RNA polymerase II transcription subunit 1 n=1 Tax=Davidia involucrata TaxID=16924 RepID=A0A5B7AA54_DAVIN